MPVVVSHFNLYSKRRAQHISTLPPNLPDARTAQRLLDILAQLEQSLRHGRQSAGAATTEMEARLANLQFENQRLRSTRTQAAQRLGLLLERLQSQLTTDEANKQSTPDSLSTIASLVQDHAA